MRTALLAAVSHDLRTPLASIKASVSSLRQTDVPDSGRRGGPAGHHRAQRRPAGRADREPARPEPAADRVTGAVPAPDRDRGGRPGRAARAGRPRRPGDRVPEGRAAGARRSGPAGTGPGQLFSNALRLLPAERPPVLRARPARRDRAARGGRPRAGVPDDQLKQQHLRAVPAASTTASAGVRPRAGRGQGLRRGHGRQHHRGRHPGRRPHDQGDHAGGAQRGSLGTRGRAVTRVLVIDDEPSICGRCGSTSAPGAYEVSTAADGTSGLAAVARDRPDVLILDLGLPDMDGTEVISGVRGWTSIPIIVLSVWGQESMKVAALDAGADDYVTKPFGMDELLARLRAAVRRAAPAQDEPVVTHRRISPSTWRPSGSPDRARATSGSPRPSGSCWRSWSATAAGWSPSASCCRKSGARPTRPRATTCASTWPSCAASWSPSRPSPATCSPSPAWATASRSDHPAPRYLPRNQA